MNLKLVLILIVLFNTQSCSTNVKKIRCKYQLNSDLMSYQCQLSITNPNEIDDFRNISGTHLKEYSDEDVHEIESLDVASKNIPKIICEKFKNIQKIKFFYRNNFQSGFETLKNCKNLSSMSISFDYMKKINDNIFSGLDKLQMLQLKNKIEWPENLFFTNQNLKVLSLNENYILDLPANIFQSQENLQDLDLSTNKIQNLQLKWFANMKRLKSLNLYANQIIELPKDIFTALTSLETIKLRNNRIKIINSNSFGILPKLSTLDLSFNRINAIDEQLIDNTGIADINLSGNKCYDSIFFDNSTTKDALFLELQNCYTNFKIIQNRRLYRNSDIPECEGHRSDNIMLQILNQLKILTDQFKDQIEKFSQKQENQQQHLESIDTKIEILANENDLLRTKIQELAIVPSADEDLKME
ncbi:hypothetical protein ACKWTF_001495 [Chironomus riparius]